MPQVADWNRLNFKNWDNIHYGTYEMSSFWGKTYFYYDAKSQKLFCKNFNIIERLLRAIFGYMSEFKRENLWEYLKDRKIVVGDCPAKHLFRTTVGQRLSTLQGYKENYFKTVVNLGGAQVDEDALIQKFKDGLDVNTLNPSCYMDIAAPALWEACFRGYYKVARYLIENGADVNSGYIGGYVASTPFHALVSHQNLELAALLLEHGLDLASSSHKGLTPLQIAITFYDETRCNTKPLIKALLVKTTDIDARDESGKTALCHACELGDLEIVQWLVKKGANVNAHVEWGSTPLNLACRIGALDMVRYLLAKGAQLTPPKDGYQWGIEWRETVYPPLLAARGNMQIIRLLVEKGADVNQGGGEDGTASLPLNEAVIHRDPNLVIFLLENGAHLNAQNRYGRTALAEATFSFNAPMAKLLLDRGADPNLSSHYDHPLLHKAIADGNRELFDLLLSYNITSVEILKTGGAVDQINWTPLHHAVHVGDEVMVAKLLQRGANKSAVDSNNKTPAALAQARGFSKIVELLR